MAKKTKGMRRAKLYDVSGDLKRKNKFCPKCGPGVFMAEHANRTNCGKCGYTEFKKSEKTDVSEKSTSPKKNTEKKEAKPEESKE